MGGGGEGTRLNVRLESRLPSGTSALPTRVPLGKRDLLARERRKKTWKSPLRRADLKSCQEISAAPSSFKLLRQPHRSLSIKGLVHARLEICHASTHAKAALVLIVLGMLAADSAAALEGGQGGIFRRHRGILTTQSTTAAKQGQATDADAKKDDDAKKFVEYYEATAFRPLEIEAGRLSWVANVTGKEADFQAKQAAEDKLDLCLADPKRFRGVEGD